ncbi:uncharacterized protein TRIADDRAFT_56822 [Trichoplax adhaerens]|uniref:Chromo domain-containing protein n=1 Tax=Trichoplax adhaerens TaxID=10228 RepID=B3RWN8_TRIAD|nr:hypothetical protein TRIADDRAFT_56822 [Trichoplax adhaerens]EDV24731.1 hypothetical protein TRIADDRAFT_56822 [Trichoplax adhaerens]|eukprot:XP_002112621.1 hypothetical protein TRIADDRAFT_56822 [Trichoplax adhaerens]
MASGSRIPCRFEVGDSVLCFEPDPTKARILYESKVTNVDFIKDESGKKTPHYRIHFKGWSHSWDRWVSETNILEYNQENLRFQAELQKKFTKKKNGRTKHSQDKDKRNESIRISDDDSESVRSPALIENNGLFSYADIELNIRLKMELENDCIRVKRKNLLVRLPKSPNVLDILKSYYEHAETSLMEGDKNGHNILREILEGIRIYFDFTLPTLLLYNCEKIQYKQIQSIMTGSNVIAPTLKNGSFQSHSSPCMS